MDEMRTNSVDDDLASSPETPEDVAVLYTWANVHGGKYRDFSASRREYRAQQRHRMVEAQREAELEAARQREEAAAREMEEARKQEKDSREFEDAVSRAEAEEARRIAQEHAEQDRQAAQRHAETAEELKIALEQAQREMELARQRAEEQAARYAEADKRFRESQKERNFVPGATEDPYYFAGPLEPTAYAPGKGVRSSVPRRVSSESRIAASYYRSRELAESDRQAGRPPALPAYGFDGREEDLDHERAAWRPGAQDARIETPEDTRERHQPSELERTTHLYTARDDDGYYDRMPLLGEQRDGDDVSQRNSAQSDLHIPPRVQQTRTGQDSGSRLSAPPFTEERVNPVSDARRRRESATDLSTRTERRPRSSERMPFPPDAGRMEMDERGSYFAGDDLRRDGRDYHAAGERESLPPRDASPEWLVRSRPVEDAARERLRADAREIALVAQHRLDEQQRLLEEDRRIAEMARADHDRSQAEEDRRLAAQKIQNEERRRKDEERLRAEESRLRAEQELRRQHSESMRAEAKRRLDEERLAEDRRRADERHQEDERRRVEDDRRRQEDERLHAEERRHAEQAERATALAREPERAPERTASVAREPERAPEPKEDKPSRDSQMVRAADGGVNLRPLTDRGPLLSSLPPMADRPTRSGAKDAVAPPPAVSAAPVPEEVKAVRQTPPPIERPPARPVETRREDAPIQGNPRITEVRAVAAASQVPPPAATMASPGATRAAATDTLQQSRERVAARWYALKGLMNAEQAPEPQQTYTKAKELPTPCLSIVSLSGGVGKTSLVATVGRALSSVGEKVLLADTTPHGLLPYYFGARELRPDVVRTFSPPPGSADAPVYMVNYETDRLNGDESKQQAMVEEMMRQGRNAGRVLLDLNGSSAWLARLLTRYNSNILVPIAPDMNSVLSIQSVDRYFSGSVDGEGRPVAPYYVLNQFDASLPLHLDVREVLRQQLGNRLLPVMIRRSPSVSEALAEGMTVIDYAPGSPVTDDYKNLAEWVRNLAAPATTGLRSIRWSER